jgi:hypothetical protein
VNEEKEDIQDWMVHQVLLVFQDFPVPLDPQRTLYMRIFLAFLDHQVLQDCQDLRARQVKWARRVMPENEVEMVRN